MAFEPEQAFKDPVNFLVNKREIKRNFYEKNPSRNAKNLKSSCDNAVKQKKHYCAVCDYFSGQKTSLTNHLKRKAHLDEVALLQKSASLSRPFFLELFGPFSSTRLFHVH
jgi:hypothetical protein